MNREAVKEKYKYKSKRSYRLYFIVFGTLLLAVIFPDWKSDELLFNELLQYFIVFGIYFVFVFLSFFSNSGIVIAEDGILLNRLIGKNRFYNWSNIDRIEMYRIRTLQFNVILKSGQKKYHMFSTMSKKEFMRIASILYINKISVKLEGHIRKSWKAEAKNSYLKGEIPMVISNHTGK